jgi:hypothetical protein
MLTSSVQKQVILVHCTKTKMQQLFFSFNAFSLFSNFFLSIVTFFFLPLCGYQLISSLYSNCSSSTTFF